MILSYLQAEVLHENSICISVMQLCIKQKKMRILNKRKSELCKSIWAKNIVHDLPSIDICAPLLILDGKRNQCCYHFCSPGEWMSTSAGVAFTPHVIYVSPGEVANRFLTVVCFHKTKPLM